MPWPTIPLGQMLASPLEYGANTPALPFDPELPRFVRITDITNNGVLNEYDRRSISREAAAGYLLQPGDIVFARSGATVGKTYLHRGDAPAAFAGYLICARVKQDQLNAEFLFKFTLTLEYQRWVKLMFRAGAQPNINAPEYALLPVPTPPLHEQDRIVEIVQTWDRAIELGTALIAARRSALEVARLSLVEQAEADTLILSKFATNTNHLLSGEDAASRGLPCIELEHIEEATGRLLGQADPSQLRGARRAFKPDDVLYGRLRPYLRKFAHARTAGVCSTEVWVLSPNVTVCLPGYLYQIIQTALFNTEANKSSGSRMPRADWDVISQVDFPLPSIAQQERVVALLSAEERALDLLIRLVDRFRNQRTALIGRLLAGNSPNSSTRSAPALTESGHA